MKFNVLIIAMPMHLDQPVNARLVVEIGMGKEVVRNNKGVLMGAKVIEIVNEVVASNLGKNIRDIAKKISDELETKGDEEIEFVVDELLKLCQSGHKLRRVGAPLQKAKSDRFIIHSWFAMETEKCKKMKLSQDMQLIQKLRHDQKRNIVTNSRVTPSWREIVSLTFSEAGVLHVNWTSFGHCVSRRGLLC
ncbi:hypothetical protein Tco_1563246 [Tanacetum coccineum]